MAILMFNPTITDVVAQFTPGCTLFDDDGNAWTYVRASSAITAHHCAMWIDTFSGQMVTTARSSAEDNAFFAGWALVDVPSGEYGWMQVYGTGQMQVSASFSKGGYPYTTTTAGEVDDASSGNQRIRRATSTEARGSTDGLINAIFAWPASSQMV